MSLFIFCLMGLSFFNFFFFKQKTAYEMRISDWSSDVCSSDLNNVIPVSVIAGEAPFFTRLLRRARWHWRRRTHLPGDGDRDTFLKRRRWRRGRNSRLFHLRLAFPPEYACASKSKRRNRTSKHSRHSRHAHTRSERRREGT